MSLSITYLSAAIPEYGGSIYQYVGDEVVTSWHSSPGAAHKCLAAVHEAKRELRRHRPEFMSRFGQMPEFRVGMHEGDVTVGGIGMVKKDLAMSGDTLNTAAHIRTACADLNKEVLTSESFAQVYGTVEQHIPSSMGFLALKGKAQELELFSYVA